ncbi:MAG: hypothetical protein WD988_04790 [Candidatus Curtissbacteria bacterium]
MKLFRGYQEEPRFLDGDLEKEHESLEAKRRKIRTENPNFTSVERLDAMGDDMIRLIELRQIAGTQFFTDDEQIAREFAGDSGFVVAIDLEEDEVKKHYQGEQVASPAGKARYVSNFVFSGKELMENGDRWKLETNSATREKEGNLPLNQEGSSQEPTEGKPPVV